MTQNVGDLLHGRAGPEQSARDAVPENVNPCPGPAAPPVRRENRSSDHVFADRRIERRDMANEQGPVQSWRPLVLQIGGDRGASHGRQREDIDAAGFGSRDTDSTGTPVDIFQPQSGGIGATQAEIGQASNHRISAAPGRKRFVERVVKFDVRILTEAVQVF
jgi:hypothetical protein